MQADDTSRCRAPEQSIADLVSVPLPVLSDDAPVDPAQPVRRQHGAKGRRPKPERRSEQSRRRARCRGDGVLRASDLGGHARVRAQGQAGMRIRVVADRVAGLDNQARHFRPSLDIAPADEKRCRNVQSVERVDEPRRLIARTVIERQRDICRLARQCMDARSPALGRRPGGGVSRVPCDRRRREKWSPHEGKCSRTGKGRADRSTGSCGFDMREMIHLGQQVG